MSAAAVRASRTAPFIAPTPTKPRTTSADAVDRAAERRQRRIRAAPIAKPPAITGTRPIRSISRPAGRAARAPAVRKIAGPSPRIDSIPVTRTSVIVATATASWRTPERTSRQSESRNVLRRTGYEMRRDRAIQPARLGTPARRRGTGGGRSDRRARRVRAARRRRSALPWASERAKRQPRGDLRRASAAGSSSPSPDASARRSRGGRPPRDRARRAPDGRSSRVASARPRPVSWRSEVKGMPETRAPRYPAASPTSSTGARRREFEVRDAGALGGPASRAYWLKVSPMRAAASSSTNAAGATMARA